VNTDEFYKMPKSLAMADGYMSKRTGEAVKLSASAKIIYTYMLSKNEFFTETLKGKHYEAQATIAKCCGVEYKSAGTILRSFLDHEILEGKKLRPDQGQWRWFYYKVHSDLILWEGSVADHQIIEENKPKYVEKTVVKPAIAPKPYIPQPSSDWDDSQLPF
jgi:hypothetical protein